MIIGITGKKGSGKSTVARLLTREYGFSRRPFAAGLKHMLSGLGVPPEILDGDDTAKSKPLDCLGGHTMRFAAQTLGTEWGRNCMGENFWVDRWIRTMPSNYKIVADDVRFLNEAKAIMDLGGTIVRVKREFIETRHDLHASEVEMDQIVAQYEITNNAGEKELLAMIDVILKDADAYA